MLKLFLCIILIGLGMTTILLSFHKTEYIGISEYGDDFMDITQNEVFPLARVPYTVKSIEKNLHEPVILCNVNHQRFILDQNAAIYFPNRESILIFDTINQCKNETVRKVCNSDMKLISIEIYRGLLKKLSRKFYICEEATP